jgi:hypothetical protein
MQQPPPTTVGGPIADKATVSGGEHPTGTVTFALYGNPNGTGTPLFTDPNVPLVNGSATSTSYATTTAGTDYWVATYNGDANNAPVSSAKAAGPVQITPAPPPRRMTLSDAQRHATAMIRSRLHRTPRTRISCRRISNSAWQCRLTWTATGQSYTAIGRFYNYTGPDGSARWGYDFRVTRTSIACVKQHRHSARCSMTLHWH